MGSLTELTKQAFGLAPILPTKMDVKLLSGTVDSLGRTLPMSGRTLLGGGSASWLGTDRSALVENGYTNHATAYSVIDYILTTGQNLPWAVYQLQADDSLKRLAKHPLYDLIYRPNPKQTWGELLRALKGYLLTTGNAYLYATKPEFGSRAGKKSELWALPAHLVEVVGGGWMEEVQGYRIPDGRGGYITYAAEEVHHFKFWNPTDAKYGLSPVAAGIDPITAAKAGITARVKQYQTQGPPGILYDESSTEPWTDAQLGTVRSWFHSFMPGRRRNGELPITGGKLGYLNLGLSPVDLDILAAIPHDKDAVADLFRFPAQLLNGSKGTTFSNMDEAGSGLYSRCLIPLETTIRDGLNKFIGVDYDDTVYLDFDLSQVPEMQADKKELAERLALSWWIPVKRKQELSGEKADWDGPTYMVPAGLVGSDSLSLPPRDDV